MLKKYWHTADLSPEESLLKRFGETNVNILRKLFSELHDISDSFYEVEFFGQVRGEGKFYRSRGIELRFIDIDPPSTATLIIKKEVEDE